MNIFFLNCANRKIEKHIADFSKAKNIDMLILAEQNALNYKSLTSDYIYSYKVAGKYSLSVFSKNPFELNEVSYVINDKHLLVKNHHHNSRILHISVGKIEILATHVDYGFYNPFVMRKIEDYLMNNGSINIIIGDFNSGYIDDNLDVENGGIIFRNGLLYFSKYEELGYVNAHKNKGFYTHINPRSKRKFRVDHCFLKDINATVKYEDEFLDNKISDHKGIKVEIAVAANT